MSQALLALQTTEGQLRTARGALATAAGFPATMDLDADVAAGHGEIAEVADSVDVLVKHALANRPDLVAAQATWAAAAAAHPRRAVGTATLPSPPPAAAGRNIILSTGGGGGNFYIARVLRSACRSSTAFSWEFDTREAAATAEAEGARTASLAQQVTLPGVRGL